MIPELGHFALALVVACAGARTALPLWGAHDRDARLMATAPRSWHAARMTAGSVLHRQAAMSQSSGEHAWFPPCWKAHPDAIAGVALQNTMQTFARAAGAELSGMETLPIESPAPLTAVGCWCLPLPREIEQGTPCVAIDDQQMRTPSVALRAATTTVSTAFTIVALRATASGAGK